MIKAALPLLAIFLTPSLPLAQGAPSTPVAPSSLPTDGRGNPKVAHLGQSVDQMIYDFMEEQQIPGLTLAIVQAPYITRIVGYGLSDIGQKRLEQFKQ